MIPISAQLKARVDETLKNLSRLSEAVTSNLEPKVTEGKPEHKEPPGTRWGRGVPHPEHDPLIEWYVFRLERAKSEQQVLVATVEAEIRYAKRVHRSPPRPTALAGHTDSTSSRDKRIAEDYPGLSPEEVGVIESQGWGHCDPSNIRVTRLKLGYDPEDGSELPEEMKLKGDDRKKRAKELEAVGLTDAQIAQRFRVSRSTVQGWLGKRGPRYEAKKAA